MTASVRQLRWLLEQATPRPWVRILHGNEKYPFPFSVHSADDEYWIARDGNTARLIDAELMVAAVAALPALLDLAEAARRFPLSSGMRFAGDITEAMARIFPVEEKEDQCASSGPGRSCVGSESSAQQRSEG